MPSNTSREMPLALERGDPPQRTRSAKLVTPRLLSGTSFSTALLGAVVALVYVIARPPLYERDGYMYHLLGRAFLPNTNPHHLLWNGVQAVIGRVGALAGATSPLPFQLAGMLATIGAVLLLYRMLAALAQSRTFAFVIALFVAISPWTWFMTFQNQPYALMFLLLIAFLACFVTPDGTMPRGWRFTGAAAAAVGMVMLQQAAVFIVVGAGVVFLALTGWRRAMAWAAATGIPTTILYVVFSALLGIRSIAQFRQWATGYLRTQHSLQVSLSESAVKSVMGIVSAFVNQEPLKDTVLSDWSSSSVYWLYGLLGVALASLAVFAIVASMRRRHTRSARDPQPRSLVWIASATIVSWAIFCFLWEPTNYYWFILLAPFFLVVVASHGPSPRASRVITMALCAGIAWNLYGNHYVDAAGAERRPEPEMRAIAQHMRAGDLLWVVDLGWSDDVDYDLLSSATAEMHTGRIAPVSDLAGKFPTVSGWERSFEDSSASVLRHGGRVFLSGRTLNPHTYEQPWEESAFADYRVERPFPIEWVTLGRELPAFIGRTYVLAPGWFAIGSDTIRQLVPKARP